MNARSAALVGPRLVTLSVAALLSASPAAWGTLRVATYNIDVSDTDSIVAPDAMYPILQAMGAIHLSGNAQPIDVLTLTELDSYPARTLGPMVDALNAIYGPGTYAYDPYVGKVSSIGHANGPSGLIYNTKTVQDLGAVGGFARVSGTYAPREPIRYQLRPLGYGADADFYVYVEHAKASDGFQQRRLYEAQDVRANADALGPSAHIIYTGDFNLHDASAEPSYQYMTQQPGSGQMVDVVNPANNFTNSNTYRGIETESAQSLFGRYDLVLPNQAAVDQPGLQYVPGSFMTFGNNGTTSRGNATNLSTNTALAELPNQREILDDLYNVSDHLPVLADYRLVGVNPLWLAWTGGTGNWSAAANWHAGVVPNLPGTEAWIDNSRTGTASVVTLDQNATVKDVILNANDTLAIDAGRTLTLAGPTASVLSGTVTNAGAISAAAVITNSGTFTQPAGGTLAMAGGTFTNSGTATLGGTQQWGAGSAFTNNTGAATFNTDAGGASSYTLTINAAGGTVTFNASQHLLALNLSGAAQVHVTAGPTQHTVEVKGLSISGSAKLDLADNVLALDYTGTSSVDGLRIFLRNGSVFSSTANGDLQHRFAVGYVDTGSSVTAHVTFLGDANLDDVVNADDYALLDRAFARNTASAHWTDGDFNYDGIIDAGDFLLIDRVVTQQTGTLSPALLAEREAQFGPEYAGLLAASVPEPSGTVVLVAGLGLFVRRRRRCISV